MRLPQLVTVVFGLLAILGSVFYAWKAFDIFGADPAKKTWAWKFHQRWFNLAGALVGWAAMYYCVAKAYACLLLGSPMLSSSPSLSSVSPDTFRTVRQA